MRKSKKNVVVLFVHSACNRQSNELNILILYKLGLALHMKNWDLTWDGWELSQCDRPSLDQVVSFISTGFEPVLSIQKNHKSYQNYP